MPNFTFYRSVDDDGGAKGDQIADGSIDALLPPITGAMRLDGATILRKVWIECDEDVDMLYGVANDGLFQAYAFLSANDDDHIADLTGNERNIAALKVTANTDTTITVEADSDTGVVAADDYITIGTEISQVDSVADNGDGTWTVTLKGSITAEKAVGSLIVIQPVPVQLSRVKSGVASTESTTSWAVIASPQASINSPPSTRILPAWTRVLSQSVERLPMTEYSRPSMKCSWPLILRKPKPEIPSPAAMAPPSMVTFPLTCPSP